MVLVKDIRLEKLANLLVNYSTKVKKGDTVYIEGDEAAIPYIIEVAKAAIKNGANVNYIVGISEINEYLLKYGTDEQLDYPSQLSGKCIREADVRLTSWGSNNTRATANIAPNRLKRRSLANKENSEIYFDRTAKGELRWCGTQFPTNSSAQEADMSLSEYEDFVYGAGLIDKDDPIAEWEKISKNQQRWVDYLNTKKTLHIISKGTDITVNFEGRKWINCDGRQNFPDGEIFTSPVENGVNGHITFSFPGIYNGKLIENIYLEVENGKIVKATASKGEELLLTCLDTDEGSRYFGEVAIGTNYGIKKFTKNMLFDEKIGGTIHMAAGASLGEAGGVNKSAIHWDMLCDMRDGGEIYADGELFYKDGQFIEDILNK